MSLLFRREFKNCANHYLSEGQDHSTHYDQGLTFFGNTTGRGSPIFGLMEAGKIETTPLCMNGWGRLFSGFSQPLHTSSLWHRSAIPGSHIPELI